MNKVKEIEEEMSRTSEEIYILRQAKHICKKYQMNIDDTQDSLERVVASNKRQIATIRKNCLHTSTSKEYHNKVVCNECGEQW